MRWISDRHSDVTALVMREDTGHRFAGGAWRGLAGTWLVTVGTLMCVSPGCHMVVNPFHDEMASVAAVTTASSRGVREAGVSPREIKPLGEVKAVPAVDGTVTHGPLYFEGPLEDKGSEDGKFAWTSEDFVHPVWWRGRFLVNVALFPISVLVTPPWAVMASDGELSHRALGTDRDAERLSETPSG